MCSLHNQDASIIVNEPLSLQEHGLDAEPRAQQPSDPGKVRVYMQGCKELC